MARAAASGKEPERATRGMPISWARDHGLGNTRKQFDDAPEPHAPLSLIWSPSPTVGSSGRRRWCNQLNPGVKREPFTEEEVSNNFTDAAGLL